MTDADGAYEFTPLAAGRYNVFVSKAGYLGAPWGQLRPSEGGKPIDAAAGQTIDHVDFALQRGGVMAGRIFDEFGEPLSGIQVSVMRNQPMNGQRQLIAMSNAQTNDLGEFRIYGVAPGQYYLQAAWRPFGPGDPTSPDRTGYPPTFFPGTTDAGAAQRFTIGAGQTIGDLVMALSPIRTVRIQGTAIDSNGRPLANALLTISQETNTSGYSSGQSVDPEGKFTLTNVIPGEYILRVQTNDDRKQVGTMKLAVGAEDIRDVRLVASPPPTISGRIVIDPAQAAALTANTFWVTASAVDLPPTAYFISQLVRVAEDLTFELTASIGRYMISVISRPAGWSVRSLRVNNIDVTDDGIEVKPNDRITGVEVELTNKVTTISGVVTDARGGPAKDCWTVIFPAESKRLNRNSRYMRAWRASSDGRFKATGLPPSDYYIIALDKMEPGQNNDPEFLDRIRAKATSFSLREGETKTFDLKLNSPQ
jgi:protocatechuate 3,4-dioxygenase beta subunit